MNALITAAAATSDETVQCDNYKKAQQIIHDAATAIDLFTIPWPVAYTSNLSGVDAIPGRVVADGAVPGGPAARCCSGRKGAPIP